MHSYCLFNNCNHPDQGAIIINGHNSITQYRFCTTNIFGAIGQYTYLSLAYNYFTINYIVDSSISQCTEQRSSLIFSRSGKSGIFASNFSKNDASSYSGFTFANVKDVAIVNYSTFEGNHAKSEACIEHGVSPKGSYLDYRCNIVNNTQDTSRFGIIMCGDDVIFDECAILGPFGNGKPFSHNGHSDGNLTIINCNLESLSFYNSGEKLTVFNINNTFTSKYLLLPHLSTYGCQAKTELRFSKFSVKNIKTCLDGHANQIMLIIYNHLMILFSWL